LKFRILSPALEELTTAYQHYRKKEHGLGSRFLIEFESAVARIVQHPAIWKRTGKHHRRCRLEHFPYAVLYAVRRGEIIISGVFAMQENPSKTEVRKKRA
jgi:plasmid stabilization system protein ParE